MQQSLRLIQKHSQFTPSYRSSRSTVFLNGTRCFSVAGPSMDVGKDYYQMLGVKKSATQRQIRLAYFSLAKKHHPDLNAHKSKQDYEHSNRLFQQINDAYQILSNPDVKHRYDDMTGNFQADASFTSTKEVKEQEGAQGEYKGFYQKIL